MKSLTVVRYLQTSLGMSLLTTSSVGTIYYVVTLSPYSSYQWAALWWCVDFLSTQQSLLVSLLTALWGALIFGGIFGKIWLNSSVSDVSGAPTAGAGQYGQEWGAHGDLGRGCKDKSAVQYGAAPISAFDFACRCRFAA